MATPTTTASGNTVTPGAGAGERSGVGSIAAGTTLALTSNSRVCTNTNQVGDRFTATVSDAVTGENGARIPAGATATVEITKLDRSENVRDKIEMGFRVVSLTFGGRTYAVDAATESADVSRVRNQPSSKDRQKVIGGAIVGAIAGQVIGKDTKGTIIGAATGAAAGAATAAATANFEGCLNDGARLAIRLTDAVQVRI
ncbi:YMGG-like glycine zipper-containing protein [Roseisolibacter sp. H3M3-2]|uniref:YMGG-like glycine zipper-containing protein n=1 Tax=Roseisolibacter sp. H3M3-2 TaxID=3031323 RepID=UPI0023DBCEFE|nr:YMGG-like glycine zipper-containing protein [Roseisolibacter sp. H3M3-2]MDF1505277.1 YMGG-like glycine zipper-containing protein [Roseisolibacter sp. H3M3-2]